MPPVCFSGPFLQDSQERSQGGTDHALCKKIGSGTSVTCIVRTGGNACDSDSAEDGIYHGRTFNKSIRYIHNNWS